MGFLAVHLWVANVHTFLRRKTTFFFPEKGAEAGKENTDSR